MPYITQWFPNDLFLEHNGIRIFHTYRNDEEEILTYWYGTACDSRDSDDDTVFDVRDLPGWALNNNASKRETSSREQSARRFDAMRKTIIAGIDAGHLKRYIDASEDRPKEEPVKANCLIRLSFDSGYWKMQIDLATGADPIFLSISEAQKAELEKAGITTSFTNYFNGHL